MYGWNSQAISSCITYTGHYIDKNWIFCNGTLFIKEMIESHTADHLKEKKFSAYGPMKYN